MTGNISISAFNHQFIGVAGSHVFSVDILEFLDHLRAIFTADERVGNTNREFLGRSSAFLDKELHDIGFGHDAIEQVLIGLVFAEVRPLLVVILGDSHRGGDDEGVTVLASQFGRIDFLALQDIDRDAQAGGADARGIGDTDRFEIGLSLFGLVPKFQVLAATFTNHHGPLGGVSSHHSLQSANRHAVLSPDAIDFAGEAGQEVRHNLLASRFVPLAGFLGKYLDIRVLGEHFSHTAHAVFIGGMSGEAFNLNYVALAAEFVSEPLGGGHGPFFLVVTHIVNTRDIQFLVNRQDYDASLDGFFEGCIQALGITGVNQDGIDLLAHQVLELLDLTGNISISAFNHQLICDASCHILGIDILEFLDHLRAIFAADERIGNTNREFLGFGRCGSGRSLGGRDYRGGGSGFNRSGLRGGCWRASRNH